MAEAIEALVRETNAKIVTDNGFKLAMEPKVTLPEDKDEIESVFTGQIRPLLHRRARSSAADHPRRFQGASSSNARSLR